MKEERITLSYRMSEVDKSIGAGGDIEGRKTRDYAINSVGKHVNVTKAVAKHPDRMAATNEDAPVTADSLKGVQDIGLADQFRLKLSGKKKRC